jgi:hypothetical protein
MAFKKDKVDKALKDLSYSIMPDFDFVIEEGRNTSINLRKVSWNNRPAKIDLRKWSYEDGGKERALKGVTLTDDGANELGNILVENGYGDTKRLVKAIKQRDDYSDDMNLAENATYTDDGSGDEYYDPKELFGE